MALTILCVSFTLFLLLGVPVAFSIGLSSLATLLYEGLPLAVGFQQMISGMNPFSFLAIPFFIFAGEIMMYGGIADKIVDFAKSVAGHVRGVGHEQCFSLYLVWRRFWISCGRRVSHGCGIDTPDEKRRLRRGLCSQRHHACLLGGCFDAY